MKSFALLSAGFALLFFAGCSTETGPVFDSSVPGPSHYAPISHFTSVSVSTPQERQQLLEPPLENYTVGPGDRLQIEILGDPTTQESVLVGPDGKIYYYLLPGIDVWGLTLSQIRQKIESGLTDYIRGRPPISITLRTVASKRVWILGRVESPGIYPLTGPTTLLEAISEAGGPVSASSLATTTGGTLGISPAADIADLRRSFVMRDGKVLPVNFYRLLKQGDLSQNIYLQPDDFIYLPSAVSKEIYVLGAVGDPTSVSYREQISLVSAIAAARGTIRHAYLSHVAVVRGTLSNPKIAVVDYKAILNGEAPNVALQPGDIVYVPFSPYRVLAVYADMILRTFVDTVAVNEGARAVTRNAGVVGVAVPVGGGGGVIGGGGAGGGGAGGGGQ